MPYRNANYSAFYVAEPFNESNLGAYASKDFCFYNMLKAWKGKDCSFPFIDAHDKTYNVRDNSDWDSTLKPRLHERLRYAKNIILFLSSNTKHSRALNEEIEYGIGTLKLPVIVVYPEFDSVESLLSYGKSDLNEKIKALWDRLPKFRNLMGSVPTLHIPFKKDRLEDALRNSDFQVQNKTKEDYYFYNR